MKNNDIKFNFSIGSSKKAVVTFLHRFHVMIFVVVILGGLAVVVLLLNAIIVKSSEANGYTSNANNAAFDQSTIQKIEELKTRDQAGTGLSLPNGRTNPFVE